MKFEDLKFKDLPNGNKLVTVLMSNGYSLDVVWRTAEKDCKIKPFEETHGKKRYIADVFPEYGDYPIFKKRNDLVTFLNEIQKHDLSDLPVDDIDNSLLNEED